MGTVSSRRPRVKPARSIRLIVLSDGRRTVRITIGARDNHYHLFDAPSDFGRAFRLDKFGVEGDESYDVLLDGPRFSCTCKGATLGRAGRCKHIDGLAALIAAGRL